MGAGYLGYLQIRDGNVTYKDGRGTYEQMFDLDLHYFWEFRVTYIYILLAKELSKTEDVSAF